MADHEVECVRRRIAPTRARVYARNALVDDPSPDWLNGCDALIIGGSGDYSVHHPRSRPWVDKLRRIIDRALRRQMPGFGICFGHQLLGYHLGCAVDTSDAHAELGTVAVSLTESGAHDPIFGDLNREFWAHTGHSDHVAGLPSDVELLAQNDALETQAFKIRGQRFYSTQFHPDMTGAEAVSRYLAYQQSLEKALEDPKSNGASLFRPGADATSVLLARFIEHLAE